MNRHGFLAALHKRLKPRTYLEIGVHRGQSLTLSRVPSVGIDPEFNVDFELQADVHLVRATSDEFFARKDPLAHLPIKVVDLAFIDGMHLAEYSLRDYLAVERFTDGGSVIVFDDMLPRNILEANRYRKSSSWTGDVYKALEALRALRPDLIVIEVATEGSGTAVVLCPDASRDGRLEGYDDWLETSAIVPDPQPVPEEILKRTRAVDPEEFLSLPAGTLWSQPRGARTLRGGSPGVRRLCHRLTRSAASNSASHRTKPGDSPGANWRSRARPTMVADREHRTTRPGPPQQAQGALSLHQEANVDSLSLLVGPKDHRPRAVTELAARAAHEVRPLAVLRHQLK